ncbi:efflux RND transporter permease subunit [Virgibacillus sp. W0430]|uniref:efflux RND transporter permease subunit n=1 Tax=Virgibacillus sp. W0430 TaxID=3391580 RepID=UPI003F44CB70
MLSFLLKRKVIVGLFISFIFVFGFYGFTKLDKELFPPISFDQALIMIETEDMPAADVEQFISKPIEQSIGSLKGVERYRSTSSIGNSTFYISMEKGNGHAITKDIETTVYGLRDDLYGVKDIYVMQFSTDQPFEFYMDISGASKEEMTDVAQQVIKPRLEALPEVREALLAGVSEREIVVELNSKKLKETGIEQESVIQAINEARINESIGELTNEKNSPSLRWHTAFSTIEDIRTISLPSHSGLLQLSDIATIEEKTSEQNDIAWKNGSSDFILVQIGRVNDVTQIEMAEAVRNEIKNINNEGLLGNVKIEEIVAQADYVENAIAGMTDNILIGAIIAIVVLLLFLRNIRATFIVALSIPASILLTVLMLRLFDYSLNLASLIGLGLGIGMMVDASIVVLESIYKKKELGLNNKAAVISGTKEVATAVFASMLTTIVVFLPIGILDDDIGKTVFILAIVITITLLSSVLVSFTWIPVLSENFLKVRKRKTKTKKSVIDQYGRTLTWVTKKKRRRLSIISLFLVLFISSFFLLTKVPMTILPDILNRYAEVIVQFEPGTTPSERELVAKKINEQLETIQDIDRNITIDNVEMLITLVNMTPEKEKTREQDEINEEILRKIRELEADFPIANVMSSVEGTSDFPVEITIHGESFNELTDIANDFSNQLKQVDGIVSTTIEGNKVMDEFVVELNEEKIEEDELTARFIQQNVRTLFAKMPAGELVQQGNITPIYVKNDSSIENKRDLLNYKIETPYGEEKLSTYVRIVKQTTPTQIDREDGERFIKVTADFEGKDMGTINRDIQKLIQDFTVKSGYTLAVSGDLEQQQQTAEDMIVILAISLFLVFVVLAIQFNSVKQPFIILSIVPLTMTGVIIGLFLTQKELNVISGIGVIMLVGIVLNNGILLIDRIKQLRNDGISVNDAVINAGKDRIRPIFMTTLTTVGGMIPLALATGSSSGYQSPLAVVIISGLLFATFITLLLIPSVYLLFEDIGRGMHRIFRKRKQSPIVIKKERSS